MNSIHFSTTVKNRMRWLNTYITFTYNYYLLSKGWIIFRRTIFIFEAGILAAHSQNILYAYKKL